MLNNKCLYLGLVLLSGCNTAGDSAAQGWMLSFAQGFAVASPTSLNSNAFDATTRNFDSSANFQAKAAAITNLTQSLGASFCKVNFPPPPNLGARANCFGPQIAYSKHPDGKDAMPAILQQGDVGIWNASGDDGTACVASELNTLMSSISSFADTALLLQAESICLFTNEGSLPPTPGSSIDFTEKLNESLTGISATKAEVKAIDNTSYEYTFRGAGSGSNTFAITVLHTASNSDNTSYSGRIYGYWGQNKLRDAFSLKYLKNDQDISVEMAAGEYPATTSPTTIFNSNNDIAMSGWKNNMNHALYMINTSTGVGSVSYAWQMSSSDSNTRVLNLFTNRESGNVSGCGFFGFGNAFSTNLKSNTNDISGFICNWAGPGALNHPIALTSNEHQAQKQCFTQMGARTLAPIPGKDKIRYAPTNSCNDTSDAFIYQWPSLLGDNPVTDNATNDLVTLTNDADFSLYKASASAAP